MAEIVWTETAIADLEAIAAFIERDSLKYAEHQIRSIIESAKILASFPQIGRVVPEFNDPSLRELIKQNFRIIYHLNQEEVTILTIYHSKRLLKTQP